MNNSSLSKTPKRPGHSKAMEISRKFALLITVLLLSILFAFMEPRFISSDNIINIFSQAAIMGILSVGLTMVVVSGEIDMSFGANASLAAVLSLIMIKKGFDILAVCAIVLVISLVIGVMNAIIVVKFKVPAMLGTIGSWLFIQGISAWISGGTTVTTSKLPYIFAFIGRGRILGVIPTPIVILLIVCILGVILLNKTVLGRYFYAVGGNREAAIHAGIDANKIKTISFIILGFLGGIAGITIASKLVQATAKSGDSYFFLCIIAVFLGSIFLKDGVPNIWGTVVASLFLAILNNGFNLVGLMWWHENVAQGFIMIASITFITIVCKKNIKGVQV